ncbi:hypothetical protein [Nonomuraea sp. NPDC048916]
MRRRRSGYQAAGRLLLSPPGDAPERMIFPHELIVRASTASPR